MADYKRVNFTESEPIAGAMYPVSDSLDSEAVGVTIVRYVPASQADNAFFLTITPCPHAVSRSPRQTATCGHSMVLSAELVRASVR